MDWAMKEKAYTQRRACNLVGIAPKVYRYRSQRADDAGLRLRLRELASQRRRFGYSRLHLLAEARRCQDQLEEALSALPGRTTDGSQAWWPKTGFGDALADGHSPRAEPALEPGLRVGRPGRQQTVPDLVCHR